MNGSLTNMLIAIACGLIVALAVTSSVSADDDDRAEYRLLGCTGDDDPTFPPGGPTFTVNFSSFPDDIGLPCEDVLTQLGSEGFRLIEVSPNFDVAGQLLTVQALHYLERRQDD